MSDQPDSEMMFRTWCPVPKKLIYVKETTLRYEIPVVEGSLSFEQDYQSFAIAAQKTRVHSNWVELQTLCRSLGTTRFEYQRIGWDEETKTIVCTHPWEVPNYAYLNSQASM